MQHLDRGWRAGSHPGPGLKIDSAFKTTVTEPVLFSNGSDWVQAGVEFAASGTLTYDCNTTKLSYSASGTVNASLDSLWESDSGSWSGSSGDSTYLGSGTTSYDWNGFVNNDIETYVKGQWNSAASTFEGWYNDLYNAASEWVETFWIGWSDFENDVTDSLQAIDNWVVNW
jgi:hypothetical protein